MSSFIFPFLIMFLYNYSIRITIFPSINISNLFPALLSPHKSFHAGKRNRNYSPSPVNSPPTPFLNSFFKHFQPWLCWLCTLHTQISSQPIFAKYFIGLICRYLVWFLSVQLPLLWVYALLILATVFPGSVWDLSPHAAD